MNVTTQCDDRFSRTKFDFAGTYKMGTSRMKQRFGSTLDFYSCYTNHNI